MARRLTGYFILFLCMGVMNRELPECMDLQDDVSNDGDVAVYSLQAPQAVVSRGGTPDRAAILAFSNYSFPLPFLGGRSPRIPAAQAHAGIGLLRLIDQQRC